MTETTPTTTTDEQLTELQTRVAALEDALTSTQPPGVSRREVLQLGGMLAAGGFLGIMLTEEGWRPVKAQPDPEDLEGTIYVSEIVADELTTNVMVEENSTDTWTVSDWVRFQGATTSAVDDSVENDEFDVSEFNVFEIDQDGMLDLSLVNDGHGEAYQAISVEVELDGSDVIWPSEFEFGDVDAPDETDGDTIEVVAWTRGVDWRAAEVWRSG